MLDTIDSFVIKLAFDKVRINERKGSTEAVEHFESWYLVIRSILVDVKDYDLDDAAIAALLESASSMSSQSRNPDETVKIEQEYFEESFTKILDIVTTYTPILR